MTSLKLKVSEETPLVSDSEIIMQLSNLEIPDDYAKFLADALHEFANYELEKEGCSNLDELWQKHVEELKNLNPGISLEKLKDDFPIMVSTNLKLEYQKSSGRSSRSHYALSRTTEFFNNGLTSAFYNNTYPAAIEKLVGSFLGTLEDGGLMEDRKLVDESLMKKGKGRKKLFCGFELSLSLFSEIDMLELDIGLIHYGAVYSRRTLREAAYFIPAIEIKAHSILGPKGDELQSLTGRLEEVVKKYYSIRGTKRTTSYEENVTSSIFHPDN